MITAKFATAPAGGSVDVVFGPLARGDIYRGVFVTVIDPGGTTVDPLDNIRVALAPNRSYEGGDEQCGPLPITKTAADVISVPSQIRLSGRVFVIVRLTANAANWSGNVAIYLQRVGSFAGEVGGSNLPVAGGVRANSTNTAGL